MELLYLFYNLDRAGITQMIFTFISASEYARSSLIVSNNNKKSFHYHQNINFVLASSSYNTMFIYEPRILSFIVLDRNAIYPRYNHNSIAFLSFLKILLPRPLVIFPCSMLVQFLYYTIIISSLFVLVVENAFIYTNEHKNIK